MFLERDMKFVIIFQGHIKYTSYFVVGDPYIDPAEEQRLACIRNCVVLIFDLVIDMKDNTAFKQPYGDDWINKLTLIYLVGLLGTDKHLTKDALVTSKISMLLHDELDSFTPFAWTGSKTNRYFLRFPLLANGRT